MSLTAVAPTRQSGTDGSVQIPRILAAVAITTADALGVAITQDTGSAAGVGPACLVSLSAAADWYWSDQDGVATASMRKVLAGDSYMVQCTPNKTQNFYCKTAASTNLIVTLEG
jgi:hypothetical protein